MSTRACSATGWSTGQAASPTPSTPSPGATSSSTPPTGDEEQFEWGDKTFHYADSDWCLFIDGSDGLSFDNRSFPNDYNAAPFMSWVYREVERAVTASQDSATLPFFIYLDNSDLQNITYATAANVPESGVPAVQQAVAVPWYLPYQGLTRLWKVSALRALNFDWTRLDTPSAPSPGVKAQIVSYAYAHWQPLDIPPGQTEIPPINASNDVGYRMRNQISVLRPIPGIPYGDPWNDPSADPAGVPGPWCVDTVASVNPEIVTTVEEDGHTASAAPTAGVRTPLYDTVFRLNLRDGLWYERGTSGNVPLAWDDTDQNWVPRYAPDQWPQSGVDSHQEPPPPPSAVSLRLGSGAGDYVSTQDAVELDFKFSLSISACLALNDWTNGVQKLVSQNKAWSWTVKADGGMSFSRSRDGSAFHDFVVPTADVPDWANTEAAILAATYVMATEAEVEAQDEVRFWLWDGTEWTQLGDTQVDPNPDELPIFNSTDAIQVGGGTAGLFRLVSLRHNVGELSEVGGGEVALMRGDVTSNPSYDRYSNVWTNHGTWSYEEMPDMPTLP